MGLFSIFKKSNTLYFPGCITYFKYPEYFELYKIIFDKLGIGFRLIEKKICSGIDAFEAGYEADARKLARRNFEIFKEEEITGIITNSPSAYKMFLQNYPEFIPDWNISVLNIWKIILEKIKDKPRLLKNKANGKAAYQDSCYLGRYCGIYDEPREILKLIGYELKEFPDSRENSMCSGSCGNLPLTNPKIADDIAKEKILQAKRMKINKIIVSSLQEYELLKKNSEDEIEILELSEAIGNSLGIGKINKLIEKSENE